MVGGLQKMSSPTAQGVVVEGLLDLLHVDGLVVLIKQLNLVLPK